MHTIVSVSNCIVHVKMSLSRAALIWAKTRLRADK